MEQLIASARLQNDPTGRRFLSFLQENEPELGLQNSYIYYDYPIYQDYEDDLVKPSFLILSPSLGVIIVKITTSTDQHDLYVADQQLTQVFSLVFSKFIKSRILRKSQSQLKISIKAYLFVEATPKEEDLAAVENETISSLAQFSSSVSSDTEQPATTEEVFKEARAILEGSKALTKTTRSISDVDRNTKKAMIASLEAEVANFDETQRKAAIALIQGPQRIRGLAGSGKTVVLAMKAAHLHLTNPESKILVTFHTKSLYEIIRLLVTRFYRQYADQDPNWENLHVMHGWGGRYIGGVYYNACQDAGLPPKKLSDVPKTEKDPLNFICGDLLSKSKITPVYDHVLIDEAQDFGENFFRLCLALTKGSGDNRSIIWAYDELQSILDVRMRTPQELFGSRSDGEPEIDLERAARFLNIPTFMSNDVVLHRCYRNAREVLVCAHAIGFALYSELPVQMLQNRSHWEDIGYEVVEGSFQVGSPTDIVRPVKNSPLSISNYQKTDELVKGFVAESFDKEVNWVAEGIIEFIKEGLNADDILVVCIDDRNLKAYGRWLSLQLQGHDIRLNNTKDSSFDEPRFRVAGSVTLTTVYQAKGNEAPVVFVVGLDSLYPQRELRVGRNKLFTAMTRSRAWVRLSGVGSAAKFFLDELEKAKQNVPHLRFNYPDPQQVETLQRDLTNRSAKLQLLMNQVESLGLTPEEFSVLLESREKKK
jgi:superfamily I DNA and RNA helicase